jgi:hypothetical protein
MDARLAELIESVEAGVPVLRATAETLVRMERDQDRVSASALSAAILRDPLMTLRVLRFLQSHRTRSQTADITTIAHALMMLGLARFFREFCALPILEDHPGLGPHASWCVRAAMSESRLAALLARDWAAQRNDLDPEEVMVAALLHDVAAPLALLCGKGTQGEARPPDLLAVRPQLFARLGLPGLIRQLSEDDESLDPRVLNVRFACGLARHCAAGWHDPAIAQDLAAVQRLLRISATEAWERVRRTALQAAREWQVFGVLPAASYLPMLAE